MSRFTVTLQHNREGETSQYIMDVHGPPFVSAPVLLSAERLAGEHVGDIVGIDVGDIRSRELTYPEIADLLEAHRVWCDLNKIEGLTPQVTLRQKLLIALGREPV